MSYQGAITPASIKLPSAPTRANHVFQGWTDVANSETVKWSASQTVTFENTDNTIYAAWKQGYYCTVCRAVYDVQHYSCTSGHHFTTYPQNSYHYVQHNSANVKIINKYSTYTNTAPNLKLWCNHIVNKGATVYSYSLQCTYCNDIWDNGFRSSF